jgi:hypothetical protein
MLKLDWVRVCTAIGAVGFLVLSWWGILSLLPSWARAADLPRNALSGWRTTPEAGPIWYLAQQQRWIGGSCNCPEVTRSGAG